MAFTLKKLAFFIGLLFVVGASASRVLELSDRFLELRRDGLWLVMFYAPWCAHCKRLEPVFGHVAQHLYGTAIRVGRVDCTRFPSVATEFGISGFPTILFMKGDEVFTFRGDRTKDDIVGFTIRMSGPPVQPITSCDHFKSVRDSHELFFVYAGDEEGDLWEPFHHAAEKFQAYNFFFSAAPESLGKHITVKSGPSVLVFKENEVKTFYTSADSKDNVNTSLHSWVNQERFPSFPKVTYGNLGQLLTTGKFLVIAVLEESPLHELTADMTEFRDMMEDILKKNRDAYDPHFQFGWVGSPSIANSMAAQVLPIPSLLVINTTTRVHHMPQDDSDHLTSEAIVLFLEQVRNQTAPGYGGDGYHTRLYRAFFEGKTALVDMWSGNPVLTTVLFGLPLGFLSLICYSVCCADIMDAGEEEEEEESSHEKKE